MPTTRTQQAATLFTLAGVALLVSAALFSQSAATKAALPMCFAALLFFVAAYRARRRQ